MLGEYNESYLPLGDLLIKFDHGENISNYERILDINHSIAKIKYEVDGNTYHREYFASFPGKVIFIKLSCDNPVLNLSVRFNSQIQYKEEIHKTKLKIKGKCPEHVDPSYIHSQNPVIQGELGMEFDAELNVLFCDGNLTVNSLNGMKNLRKLNQDTAIYPIYMASFHQNYLVMMKN